MTAARASAPAGSDVGGTSAMGGVLPDLGEEGGDLDEVVVLRIDPARITAPLVVEDLTGSGANFPHVYGPITLDAVVASTVVSPLFISGISSELGSVRAEPRTKAAQSGEAQSGEQPSQAPADQATGNPAGSDQAPVTPSQVDAAEPQTTAPPAGI